MSNRKHTYRASPHAAAVARAFAREDARKAHLFASKMAGPLAALGAMPDATLEALASSCGPHAAPEVTYLARGACAELARRASL